MIAQPRSCPAEMGFNHARIPAIAAVSSVTIHLLQSLSILIASICCLFTRINSRVSGKEAFVQLTVMSWLLAGLAIAFAVIIALVRTT